MKDKETKDWKERIKVCDNDWQGLSLFIDEEGVFDEYEAGGVLKDSADEKLKRFIYHEIEKAREEGKKEELKSLDKWYYKRLEKEFNPLGYVLHEEIFNRLSKLN